MLMLSPLRLYKVMPPSGFCPLYHERMAVSLKTRWFSLLRVDVVQFGNLFLKRKKINFKRSSSIKFYFFSSAVALAVSILTTNQWEQKFTGRQVLLPSKFYKNKSLFMGSSPYQITLVLATMYSQFFNNTF